MRLRGKAGLLVALRELLVIGGVTDIAGGVTAMVGGVIMMVGGDPTGEVGAVAAAGGE